MIAAWLGEIAKSQLRQARTAEVLGVTSGGIFLRLETDWVVFITTGTSRGPLTVNISSRLERAESLQPGTRATVTRRGIFFPEIGVLIETSRALAWCSPPRPGSRLSPAERSRRLSEVLTIARASGKDYPLLALALSNPNVLPNLHRPYHRLQRFIHAFSSLPSPCQTITPDTAAFCNLLEPFLGVGRGLTPSGDDLILGLLLALSRWGDILTPSLSLADLMNGLLSLTKRKTTLLSANLIECAGRGLADERLLMALDGLVSGNPDAAAVAESLAGWGSASGMDALTGMALALVDRTHQNLSSCHE